MILKPPTAAFGFEGRIESEASPGKSNTRLGFSFARGAWPGGFQLEQLLFSATDPNREVGATGHNRWGAWQWESERGEEPRQEP